ncbi:MAG: hypothetical protein QOI15_1608 [Pseudonocardiales bacterium]|nr:hypothetical protein [Pseudonocardiales bacterium]MDT4920706.1 hypothetical protein [Pseudonocardiales bacterium]MDT4940827.1 hypothetical protein [Pseudonocardiales bacterium]
MTHPEWCAPRYAYTSPRADSFGGGEGSGYDVSRINP